MENQAEMIFFHHASKSSILEGRQPFVIAMVASTMQSTSTANQKCDVALPVFQQPIRSEITGAMGKQHEMITLSILINANNLHTYLIRPNIALMYAIIIVLTCYQVIPYH